MAGDDMRRSRSETMVALRCGAAVRDITPTFPVALHGYGARDQLSLSDAQAHTPLIGAHGPFSPHRPTRPVPPHCGPPQGRPRSGGVGRAARGSLVFPAGHLGACAAG